MRKQCIYDFIQQVSSNLNQFLNNEKICFITELYNKAKQSLLNTPNEEFLQQTLDVLENYPVKYHIFKLKECFFEKKHSAKLESETSSENTKIIKNNPNLYAETASKPKFKGSEFIFDRIKRDGSIDKDQIIIGYLDRFKGIREIKFNEFKGVHEDPDGIPQHRIRYFKINNKIVWDRDNKINYLTGEDFQKYFIPKIETELIVPVSNENIINNGLILK